MYYLTQTMDSDKITLESLKKTYKELSHYIEQEFIKLNFKSARCAHRCFTLSTFSEAINCEKECLNSIQTAQAVMKSNEHATKDKLESCLKKTEQGYLGLNEGVGMNLDINSICYKQYIADLEILKSEMEKEFSYYY